MKKKLISVLLSAAMATTMLAGCGSTAADTGAAPAETKATEEKTFGTIWQKYGKP